MSSSDKFSDHGGGPRRQMGMGLAARFTLGLGFMTFVIAVVAGYLFLQGAEKLNRNAADHARLKMALTSSSVLGRLGRSGSESMPEISGRYMDAGNGSGVSYGKGPVAIGEVREQLRIYQLRPGEGLPPVTLFAPSADYSDAAGQLLVLVILVLGGLVIMTVLFGAITARRVAAPLKVIIDDVLAISRGRYDRRINAEGAASEVAFLARAVDRMVHGLVEGKETQRKLDESQREAESLRELRRNLQPMTVLPPQGFMIDTCLMESFDVSTSDFVDAMTDSRGLSTVVVGSTVTRGMPGALLMAMTRAYLRGSVLQGGSPSEACNATNASLNRDLAQGLYASAMVARLNASESKVDLVSSGHKSPAIRWDEQKQQLVKLQPNGIALGFDEGPVFQRSLESLQVTLGPGDSLFLFSPAVFECMNEKNQVLGEKGVYQLARYAIDHGLELMKTKLLNFMDGNLRSDLAFALLQNTRNKNDE